MAASIAIGAIFLLLILIISLFLHSGRALTPLEMHHTRLQFPVPRNVGCQYATDYCATYW
jgi:hypothetical protein